MKLRRIVSKWKRHNGEMKGERERERQTDRQTESRAHLPERQKYRESCSFYTTLTERVVQCCVPAVQRPLSDLKLYSSDFAHGLGIGTCLSAYLTPTSWSVARRSPCCFLKSNTLYGNTPEQLLNFIFSPRIFITCKNS